MFRRPRGTLRSGGASPLSPDFHPQVRPELGGTRADEVTTDEHYGHPGKQALPASGSHYTPHDQRGPLLRARYQTGFSGSLSRSMTRPSFLTMDSFRMFLMSAVGSASSRRLSAS